MISVSMDDSAARAERARLRSSRMTVTVLRSGADEPIEDRVDGPPGVALATYLTTIASSVAGRPVRTIPRAEWPIVRRASNRP